MDLLFFFHTLPETYINITYAYSLKESFIFECFSFLRCTFGTCYIIFAV